MPRNLLPLLLLFFHFNARAADVVVITHPTVPATFVTRNFARALFGMRVPQWPGDGGTTVFVLPDGHPLHASFAKTVLDVFPQQLRIAWDRQVFSGTGQAPIEVSSEEEMLTRVTETPGSVGYLSKDKLDAKKVRLLEIK
ncbi:hypothetical protein [Methylococcus sp. EFPC2]|uniref:hypothetical protein n=1 Tax=Methylococcus sp. EFPC2 TaxID=2812648 RepID=UPI001967B564|nr:hypothetical protein [Methylococcus sp. EFPC2]QSA98669.1 hypothetical protein JWZ97_07725 [Methylococcus sp. EFPC2]